jgi:hypothetical protein
VPGSNLGSSTTTSSLDKKARASELDLAKENTGMKRVGEERVGVLCNVFFFSPKRRTRGVV